MVFGDGRGYRRIKGNPRGSNAGADGNARRSALKVLIESKTDDLLPMLKKLVGDFATAAAWR